MVMQGLTQKVVARFLRVAGGSGFQVFVPIADPKRAFNDAVGQARHESGHGGYSGTIGEKGDYNVRSREPLTKAEAQKVIDREIGTNDKWGPAWALPIADSTKEKTQKVQIQVTALENEARTLVTEALTKKYSEAGLNLVIEIDSIKPTTKAAPKVEVKKESDGWFMVKRVGYDYPEDRRIHKTKPEAVEALKGRISGTKHSTATAKSGDQFQLLQIKNLATYIVGEAEAMTWQAEATITHEKSSVKIVGWMFYGIASS